MTFGPPAGAVRAPSTCQKIKYSNVRHEALLFRMEVRDLRCSAVVAVG